MRYRIQENQSTDKKKWGTNTKQDTGFKNIQGTDTKNEGTDTVPHKEKCGTTQDNIKGRKPTSEQKFLVPVLWRISSIYGTRRVPITYEERWGSALTNHMDPENFTSPRCRKTKIITLDPKPMRIRNEEATSNKKNEREDPIRVWGSETEKKASRS